MKTNSVVVLLLTSMLIQSHSAHAQLAVSSESIDGNISVQLLLGTIQKSAGDALEIARNSGDYRLFKNTVELKSILDAWENANPGLKDKAYKTLKKPQQEFVEGVHSASKKLEKNSGDAQPVLEIISKLENQAVIDASILNGKPAIFSYAPRILTPEMKGNIFFTIRGINFKKVKPRIRLPNKKLARRMSLTNREAVFSIPASVFKFDRSKAGIARLTFSYLSSKKTRKQTEISVLLLPQMLAEFTLQINTRDTVRDIWEGSRQFYWAGDTESKILSQGPHDNGWRIMASSLKQGRVWGQAGKGCSLASSDERGFAIEVRLDVTEKGVKGSATPNQYCEWHWKETFDRQVITPQEPINGNLNWSQNLSLPLPINTAGLLLQVMTWNGNAHAITGSFTEPFFEVIKSEEVLEIRPRLPDDLNVP